MEAARTEMNIDITKESSITVTTVTNIRADLKLFAAIYAMKDSPLRDVILNPCTPQRVIGDDANYKYKGYVSDLHLRDTN